jgi:hypothetical protein
LNAASNVDESVHREKLRWFFDPDLTWNRAYRFVEAFDSCFGLEHVDDVETLFGLSGGMKEKALER